MAGVMYSTKSNIRCKFYDDDGLPIVAEGCRRFSSCKFIHPNNAAWPTAMRRSYARKSPPPPRKSDSYSFDYARSPVEPSTSRGDVSWGKSTSRNDSGTWGNSTSRDDDVSWGKPTSKDNSAWRTPTSRDHNDTWGTSTSTGDKGSWANDDSNDKSDNAWASTSGWGASGWDAGWADDDQTNKKATSSGWNKPTATDKPTPAPKQSMDVDSPAPPPQSTTTPQNPTTATSSSTSARKPRPPLPTRKRAQLQPANSPAIPAQEYIPLSAASVSGRFNQDDVHGDPSTSTAQLATLSPKEIYQKLVKEVVNAISIRYKLSKAVDKKAKWRAARVSSAYIYSTPSAREKLEAVNKQYSDEIKRLESEHDMSIYTIVRYSNALDTAMDLKKKGLDLTKIASYNAELKEWVKELDLPRRLMEARREKDEKEAIENRKLEEVNSVKRALEALEVMATDISDTVFDEQHIQYEGYTQDLEAAKEKINRVDDDENLYLQQMFAELGVNEDMFQPLTDKLELLDQKNKERQEKVQMLKEKAEELENELIDLREKDLKIQIFCEQAQQQIKEMEEWAPKDKERLDALAIEMENLHTLPRPIPNTPPVAITTEDFAPYISKFIDKYVAEEVKPALEKILTRVHMHDEQLREHMDKLIELVVNRTYELCQSALKEQGYTPQQQQIQLPPPS